MKGLSWSLSSGESGLYNDSGI